MWLMLLSEFEIDERFSLPRTNSTSLKNTQEIPLTTPSAVQPNSAATAIDCVFS